MFKKLLVVLYLLFFTAISYFYLTTRSIQIPDSTSIAGQYFWLASVNIYLATGAILMAPEEWRHFENIDRTLIYPSGGSFALLIPLEEALGADDQGYPFIQSVLAKMFAAGEINYGWFIKFNYLYFVFLGLLSSIFIFLSFRSLFISAIFYFLYLFVAHLYLGFADHKWMIGVLIVFYVSFLIYFLKEGRRFNYSLLILYAFIAGWADAIRIGDGVIGILLLIFAVFFLIFQDNLRKISLKFFLKRFWLFLLVTIIFLSPGLFMSFARSNRDQKYFNGRHSRLATHHLLWHHVFIGLGYVENDYGIKYDEHYLGDFIRSKNPQMRDYSREEDIFLRNLYIKYAFESPSLILDNIRAKLVAVHLQIGKWFEKAVPSHFYPPSFNNYFFYLGILSIFMLSRNNRERMSIFWLLLVTFVLTIIPALLVVPEFSNGYQAVVFMTMFYLGVLILARLKVSNRAS